VTTFPQKDTSSSAALDVWIARATHGLCAQAEERVRREIASHYAEAMEDLCETGMMLDAAAALTIEGLGDAVTANKALRRTYLTTWQQRLLAGLSRPAKQINVLEYGVLVFGLCVASLGALFFACNDAKLFEGAFFTLARAGLFVIICFVASWVLNDIRRESRSVSPRRWSSAQNRVYPWILLACVLALYILWRVVCMPVLRSDVINCDLLMASGGFILAIRLHRMVSFSLLAGHSRRARLRTGLLVAYWHLLVVIVVALISSRPVWSVITTFLPFRPHAAYPYFDLSDVYGFFGLAVAVDVSVAALLWQIGFFLSRKATNEVEPGLAKGVRPLRTSSGISYAPLLLFNLVLAAVIAALVVPLAIGVGLFRKVTNRGGYASAKNTKPPETPLGE